MAFVKGDIWMTEVAFESDPNQSKVRPALVIAIRTGNTASGLYITSKNPRPGYKDFPIKNWKQCGLEKPSTIRIDHPVPMDARLCKEKIGTIDNETRLLLEIAMADFNYSFMKDSLSNY